jgi:8-oxo-dGTP pyrophosphatase MutT (NUDIX family)
MHTRRVNVRGIIFKDGKLLVAKHKNSDGIESDYWGTFGGGLDVGEPIHDGLVRELIEETGIVPTIGKLLFIQQFFDGEKEQLELFFHVTNPEDYLEVDTNGTSHGTIELGKIDFVDPSKEPVLPAFLQTVDIAGHIEHDRPVLIWNELQK